MVMVVWLLLTNERIKKYTWRVGNRSGSYERRRGGGTLMWIPFWFRGFGLNHLDLNKDQWQPFVNISGSRFCVGGFELNHVFLDKDQ